MCNEQRLNDLTGQVFIWPPRDPNREGPKTYQVRINNIIGGEVQVKERELTDLIAETTRLEQNPNVIKNALDRPKRNPGEGLIDYQRRINVALRNKIQAITVTPSPPPPITTPETINYALPEVGSFTLEFHLKSLVSVDCVRDVILTFDIKPIIVNGTTINKLEIHAAPFLEVWKRITGLTGSDRLTQDVNGEVVNAQSSFGSRGSSYRTRNISIGRKIQLRANRFRLDKSTRSRFTIHKQNNGNRWTGDTSVELVGSKLLMCTERIVQDGVYRPIWTMTQLPSSGQAYIQTLSQTSQSNKEKSNSGSKNTPLLVGSLVIFSILVLAIGYLWVKKLKSRRQ